MRSLPLLLLLVIPASALATERATPPPSATNLVRYRPVAWQPPATVMRAGMRFDPETGEAIVPAVRAPRGATSAALRQDAEATVRRNADGSRHATLGSAFRSWTVVRIGEDGRLVTDCVDDLDEATRRVEGKKVPR